MPWTVIKPPRLDNGPLLAFCVLMDVKTAIRTVELFEMFAEVGKPMTLSEIARALNAPHSSCFNLVRSLESCGYLYSVGGNKRTYPTRKLFDNATAIASYEPAIPHIRPVLTALRDAVDETVILGALHGKRAIYLAVVEGRHTIRYSARAGDLKPLYGSAIGKALLMAMTPVNREKIARSLTFERVTDGTIANAEALLAELNESEKRGYARTVSEHVAEVGAIGCPVVVDGVVYSVAIAGPAARIVPASDDLAARIKAALADVERSARDRG